MVRPKPRGSQMTKHQKIAQVYRWYLDGMIREPEMTRRLDALKVRGADSPEGYVGYDYDAQRWVRFDQFGNTLQA